MLIRLLPFLSRSSTLHTLPKRRRLIDEQKRLSVPLMQCNAMQQQHTVSKGGQGEQGASLRLQELRASGGGGQQLRVPERGGPRRRRAHAGAVRGRGLRPHAATHQVRPLRRLRPWRGRLLPG